MLYQLSYLPIQFPIERIGRGLYQLPVSESTENQKTSAYVVGGHKGPRQFNRHSPGIGVPSRPCRARAAVFVSFVPFVVNPCALGVFTYLYTVFRPFTDKGPCKPQRSALQCDALKTKAGLYQAAQNWPTSPKILVEA